MINMQETDLFIALAQHKEHRIQQIQYLIDIECKMHISLQILALMTRGKWFHALPIANARNNQIVEYLNGINSVNIQ